MKPNNKLSSRLKGIFNKRRRVGLCVLFTGILFAILTSFTNYFLHLVCKAIAIVCISVGLYIIFIPSYVSRIILEELKSIMFSITRKILSNLKRLTDKLTKVMSKVGSVFSIITKFIRNVIKKIKEKFSFGTNGAYKGPRMANGYVDVKEKAAIDKGKAVRRKKKKYKNMNNVERIRFFYERKVTGAMKSGIEVEESMTPNETGTMLVSHKYMKDESMELIDKYNFARYDDEAVVTDDMVERVKKL